MKQVFLFAAVLSCCGCTYQNAQSLTNDAAPAGTFITSNETKVADPSLVEVDVAKARKMVKHFKDKETKKDIGGYVQFDPAELLQLLQQPYITDVKLVHAAYLDDDDDNSKRNAPTILICVQESAGATTYKYYTSSTICPPPSGGCNPESN